MPNINEILFKDKTEFLTVHIQPEIKTRADEISPPRLQQVALQYIQNQLNEVKDLHLQQLLGIAKTSQSSLRELTEQFEDYRAQYSAIEGGWINGVIDSVSEVSKGSIGVGLSNLVKESVDAVVKSIECKNDIINTLVERETNAHLHQIESIKARAVAIVSRRNTIKKALATFNNIVGNITASEEQKAKTKRLALDVTTDICNKLQQCYEKTTNKLRRVQLEGISAIQDPNSNVTIRIFACYFIFSTNTAKINKLRDLRLLPIKRHHKERNNEIASELNLTPSIIRKNYRGSSLEVKAIAAKMKRIDTEDANTYSILLTGGYSYSYAESKFRIDEAIELIKKSKSDEILTSNRISFSEKVSFFSDLIFNKVDRNAFLCLRKYLKSARPNQFFQMTHNHTVRVRTHGDHVEKDIAENLFSIYANSINNNLSQQDRNVYAKLFTDKINRTIIFYYEGVITSFINFFSEYYNRDSLFRNKVFQTQALEIINRELADFTPSNYYHSPLSGIAEMQKLFLGGCAIKVQHIHCFGLAVDYTGKSFEHLQEFNLLRSKLHLEEDSKLVNFYL